MSSLPRKDTIMFGDMLSNMKAQQEALQQKLADMRITESTDGVSVTVSGTRQVINVSVAPELLSDGDAEQLEDLLVITLNRALSKAAETEANEAQSLMSGILPGGMDALGGMFGQ